VSVSWTRSDADRSKNFSNKKFLLEQEAQEEESYKHKKKQHLVTKILEDYYELLDLDALRWRATQDDIKKACECIFWRI
jgi:hypothetical protein